MKTNLLSLTLAITVLAASAAVASDQTKSKDVKKATNAVDKSKKTQASSANDKGGVPLTGSYIKQNIRRSGHITDGANQVIVIDRDTIERSGASDVRQLLVRQGIH